MSLLKTLCGKFFPWHLYQYSIYLKRQFVVKLSFIF